MFHQLTTPGNYWVTLQAEDEGGERGIGKIKLQVSEYTNPTGYILDRRDHDSFFSARCIKND